jgi:hypothetical protein
MKSIPDIILRRLKQLEIAQPFVPTIDLALNDGPDTHIRLVRDTRACTIAGSVYAASGFDAQVLGVSKRDGIPTFTVAISDPANQIRPYLQTTNYFAGATVTFAVIAADLLTLDYEDLVTEYDVIKAWPRAEYVHMVVGGPNLLRQRFPWGRFLADLCEYTFGDDPRCPYVPKGIAAVTLTGTDPVAIQTDAAHQAETGDLIALAAATGVTPSLAGNWTVTVTGSDTMTLDGTDSSDYAGSYTSGGTAGFAVCERTLDACRKRESTANFWGCLGLRSHTFKLAI